MLTAVLQDYDLDADEKRRVRRLIGDVAERAELPDLDLPPEEMEAAVVDVLTGIIHYVDAYEELFDHLDGETELGRTPARLPAGPPVRDVFATTTDYGHPGTPPTSVCPAATGLHDRWAPQSTARRMPCAHGSPARSNSS